MIALTLDTWVSLAVLVAAIASLYIGLKRDFAREFAHIEQRFEQVDKRFEQVDKRFEQVDKRFDTLERRFERLEDKVFELGVGLRPLVEQAQREQTP